MRSKDVHIYILRHIHYIHSHIYKQICVYISRSTRMFWLCVFTCLCFCACVSTGHEDRYSRCVPKMVNRVPDLSISTQNFAHTSVHTHALVMPLAHPRNTPFCTRFISSSYFPRTHTHSHISLHTQTHTQTPLSLTHAYIHTLR